MVDLVKVRKKAKEKKEKAQERPQESPQESPQAPVAGPQENEQRTTSNERVPTGTEKIASFLETAGQRRATNKTATADSPNPQLQVLTFEIADESYAIDIEKVVEIVTPRSITRVPNAGQSIVGILSLRGAVVTLIDVRARLGHRSGEGTAPDAAVIVSQFDRDLVGFVVDRVHRVLKIDADSVQPHPVVHASEQDDSVRGVFRHGESLTILLDLERLLGTYV